MGCAGLSGGADDGSLTLRCRAKRHDGRRRSVPDKNDQAANVYGLKRTKISAPTREGASGRLWLSVPTPSLSAKMDAWAQRAWKSVSLSANARPIPNVDRGSGSLGDGTVCGTAGGSRTAKMDVGADSLLALGQRASKSLSLAGHAGTI